MLKLQANMYPWLVIAISGVTCGGKTSLIFQLKDLLTEHFCSRKRTVSISTISQDDFFLKTDDPRHVYLPALGHNNWELPTAVDLDKMHQTVLGIISGERANEMNYKMNADHNSQFSKSKIHLKGILLIEGFLVLNHKPTRSLCHLGYYLLLSRAVCESRRGRRSYDPPDVPGYFEQCVWPEHVYRRAEVIGKGRLVDQSDPMSMDELNISLKEENAHLKDEGSVASECSGDGPMAKCEKQPPTIVLNSIDINPMDKVTGSKVNNKGATPLRILEGRSSDGDNLWMRIGGEVQTLEGFSNAGLGLVNKIRVLNGGVISKEKMAKLVLKDVLNEIERLNFE